MTADALRSLFPNISSDALKRNADLRDGDAGTTAKLERDSGNGALGKKEVQRPTRCRYFVRFTSVRRRLIDQSNLCYKFAEDVLRYAGILPDDSPAFCTSEVRQIKAGKDEAERVIIQVWEIPLCDAVHPVTGQPI